MRLRPITIAIALMAIAAAWQLFQHHYPRPLPVRETITGSAYAIDGDTLRMDGRRIRLVGIDTCESGQPARRAGKTIDCGDWAKWQMVEKIRGHRVRCDLHDKDQYGRDLGTCFSGATDLNKAMLTEGAAFLYESRDRAPPPGYTSAERTAQDARSGVWGFDQVAEPWTYRREQAGR